MAGHQYNPLHVLSLPHTFPPSTQYAEGSNQTASEGAGGDQHALPVVSVALVTQGLAPLYLETPFPKLLEVVAAQDYPKGVRMCVCECTTGVCACVRVCVCVCVCACTCASLPVVSVALAA